MPVNLFSMDDQTADRSALARSFLQAVWGSDWQACRAMLSEAAVYEDPLLEAPIIGREPIIETFKLCHAWGRLDPRLKQVFSGGKMAAAEFRVHGTVIKALLDLPQSAVGKEFDFAECDIFEFDDQNLIKRMTIYADVASFMKQIGVTG